MQVSRQRGVAPAGRAALGVLAIIAALLGAPPTPVDAAPAAATSPAAGAGYVRLAHLSPDTPTVDVYLRQQADGSAEQRFPGVAYGAFSHYLRVPAGTYAVAMRPAGAPRTTAPVLTTQVSVDNGAAYTVAGVGRYADLGLRVLRDDLSLPAVGQVKIRVVQASVRVPVLDVDLRSGPTLGVAVAFATTTDYRQVAPGAWRLRVHPTGGGAATELPCTLRAGSVYSVLVLDAPGGGLRTRLITDAGRRGAVPTGGVATGGGGAAPTPARPGAALLSLTLTGTIVTALRRRAARRARR